MEMVSKFESWMNKITKHKIIDKARYNEAQKRKGKTVSLNESINPEYPSGPMKHEIIPLYKQQTPEDILIEAEKKALVQEWINILPEKDRRVIILHYLDELTTKHIAYFLGISQANVKKILQRAREKLKVIKLHYLDGFNTKQIASSLGISQANVKKLLKQAQLKEKH